MKIAILSESSADEAALHILAGGILGVATEPIAPEIEDRGWPAVLHVLPAVIRKIQYRTDADGLIVVADSNHTPSDVNSINERTNRLTAVVQATMVTLKAVPNRPRLRVAIGTACPAIEAWLLSHRYSNVSEAAWRRGLETKTEPYSKRDLKIWLYGVERPSLKLETEKMIEAAGELSSQIKTIEDKFPIGFGMLAAELRSWLRVGPT